MQPLKTKVETIDQDMKNLPDLINVQFRFVNSQFSRVFSELGALRNELIGEIGSLRDEVRALPRVIAEMIAEQKKSG